MNQPSKAPKTSPRAATSTPKRKRKSRDELNNEARALKREKKRRGNAAGSRTQVESESKKSGSGSKNKDPRIGSKVPVPLVLTAVVEPVKAKPVKAAKPQEKPVAKPKVTPEQELDLLENDERLNTLLDRLDAGETLGKDDQNYLEKTLDRIDALMVELGIELGDEDDEEEEKQEDIFRLLKGGNGKDGL